MRSRRQTCAAPSRRPPPTCAATAAARAPSSSGRRGPTSATTRRTRRCCWRRRWASRRGRSPSGSASALGERLGDDRRAGGDRRARLPQPVHGRRAGTSTARARCCDAGERLRRRRRAGERVNVEFVSANPTGPMTVASARHAAYGDALARILEFAGNRVEREYYVNDAGSQVQRFGESIQARARGEEPPRTATRATTWPSWPSASTGAADADPDELARRGHRADARGRRARRSSASACDMDRFFSERSLHEARRDRAGARAARAASTSTRARSGCARPPHGDDKDRVLRRSNGELTYFAPDIAYHADKLERGYDRAIDVLGRRPPRLHRRG